jgi:hypothetical protein
MIDIHDAAALYGADTKAFNAYGQKVFLFQLSNQSHRSIAKGSTWVKFSAKTLRPARPRLGR